MFESLKKDLARSPKRWLVTGAAGFIGSHLVDALLKLNQTVVGLDNFSTGNRKNLPSGSQGSFTFVDGDVERLYDCKRATEGVDYVLHQAALGSVPRSIEEPVPSFSTNVQGFVNLLTSAKDASVKRVVYASSSSVYGDHPQLPKQESQIGRSLSPYALTKYVNELTADIFSRTYGIDCIGLRYFNVFGARQDPDGPYAAVIPIWIRSLIKDEPAYINGDGETSRDFCYVENVIQANLLAALAPRGEAKSRVYNISCGHQTTLHELFEILTSLLLSRVPGFSPSEPIFRNSREGDIPKSLADITLAREELGYSPHYQVREGLALAMDWYIKDLK